MGSTSIERSMTNCKMNAYWVKLQWMNLVSFDEHSSCSLWHSIKLLQLSTPWVKCSINCLMELVVDLVNKRSHLGAWPLNLRWKLESEHLMVPSTLMRALLACTMDGHATVGVSCLRRVPMNGTTTKTLGLWEAVWAWYDWIPVWTATLIPPNPPSIYLGSTIWLLWQVPYFYGLTDATLKPLMSICLPPNAFNLWISISLVRLCEMTFVSGHTGF